MKRVLLMTAVAGLVCLHRGAAAPDATESIADDQFVVKAAASGSKEIQASKLALRLSETKEVKAFAQRLIDDHSRVNRQLLDLAGRKKIAVPDVLQPEELRALDRLGRLKGPAFEKAYTEQMVKDHRDAITLFDAESRAGKDADLKTLATQTRRMLREHEETARTLRGRYTTPVK
jgi:putative membrane protein